ncbi:putative integral membrane zinc-ribbon metal-binding protein [Hirsutella rhossiliensis]|uniref:Endoplasmic reticulum junction formation protein lunapark n=1 Tax=Hirsutella rhossiliensis TaxID=111463 RepID=A0A9P8MQ54_9HYPO|nr:putative integral membrane zinc-ribbon metal-binding protein [Hirsutella rhossiliensis]KAH0959047.1 putative integral membrane zinc-ribbon metal-binding protein [Hirsutella rhossiliensis]
MVSFWPWKGDASSPASFEKTLSALSAKITDTQARLDQRRTSARRAKVLWTLYLSFAYLVYAIVLLLVVGYRNLGIYEWTGMAGGPVVIYGARALNTTFYSYRIGSLEARLKEQQAERAKTIQKLKDMTKYDSTLELIEKYGGPEGTPQSGRKKNGDAEDAGRGNKSAQSTPGRGTPSRTTMPPPPTANIQRRSPAPAAPGTPVPSQGGSPPPPPSASSLDPSAEFAPNAFAHAAPPPLSYAAQHHHARSESHWYDRLFDVLLGEDETAAKNRIALVCHSCRLVNGLAPPGTKTLAGLGVWKCMACGAANGEVDEGRKIVREVLSGRQVDGDEHESVKRERTKGLGADNDDDGGDDDGGDDDDGDDAGMRSRRGKNKK